jgi:4-amino-4-deoxy-L-arabinose transferase-like glycosyltransferase
MPPDFVSTLVAGDERARRFLVQYGHFAVAATLLLGAASLYSGLGRYDDFYDAGVYLESARMMLRGYHPYSTIFDSQPPLWLPFVYTSFRLFGASFFAAQSSIAATGILVALATALAVRQLAGWGAAALATAAVMLSPLEFYMSRTVSPEVPASALSLVAISCAIAYARCGDRRALGLAAASVTCSSMIKLLGLFTFPGLALLVAARHWNDTRVGRRRRAALIAADGAIVLAISGALVFALLFHFGAADVWHQAVEFHWVARSAIASDPLAHRLKLLEQLFARDHLLGAMAILAMLSTTAGTAGLALFGWLLITAIGLLFHQPLFEHHLVMLIPPIAIAGSVGWARLSDIATKTHRWNNSLSIMLSAALPLLVDAGILALLAIALAHRPDSRDVAAWQSASLAPDHAAAQTIARLTAPNDTIVTDAQGIAFLANRDVPPELTDTSFVRIATGYLTLPEVIAYTQRADVRLLMLWSGRLATLPGMRQWAASHFPYHVSIGAGRELYSMRPIASPP